MSDIWSEVLAHTEAMIAAAKAGAFERVSALELDRRELLKGLPAACAETKALLAEVIERDRELIAIVECARREAADLLRQARQAQACAGAYLGVAFGR